MFLRLFLCPIESGVHYYEKDFDTNGVVYALAKHFGGPNSIRARMIATRFFLFFFYFF